MNSALGRIPDLTAERRIRELSSTAAQFKSRQRTTGRSGQLGYAIESEDDWDLIEAFAATPPFTAYYAEYRLTFTGDGSQRYPIVQPATDIRINGTADSNQLALNYLGRPVWSDGSNIVQAYYVDYPDPVDFESETQLSWIIGFEYMGTITARMKARGRGSSPGTWSIERIA